jgi:hypothetical protein
MKARIQVWGIVDTTAHATTVRDAIAAELVGKDIFEERALDWSIRDDGAVEFVFDCRFNAELDRDTIVTWIRNQVAEHPTVKTWFLEITVWWHPCDHDDTSPDGCSDAELKRWWPGQPWPA